MAQLNLYYRTQLETKVSLLPKQIKGNMDDYLLKNLKKKVEKIISDHGIVIRVTKLIDYEYGFIDKINFMGTTVYNVKYDCFLCSPIKNLEIVGILDNIIPGYLIAHNGPVIIAIPFNTIDTQKFEIKNDMIYISKTDTPIKRGDFVKVSIINITRNSKETKIYTVCKLLNLATKNEIKSFEDDQTMILDDGIVDSDDDEFI